MLRWYISNLRLILIRRMSLVMELGALALGSGAVVGGIFGMNLATGLEEHPHGSHPASPLYQHIQPSWSPWGAWDSSWPESSPASPWTTGDTFTESLVVQLTIKYLQETESRHKQCPQLQSTKKLLHLCWWPGTYCQEEKAQWEWVQGGAQPTDWAEG